VSAEVGSAFFTLVPSAKGMGSALQREMGGEVARVGDRAGKDIGDHAAKGVGTKGKAIAGAFAGAFAAAGAVSLVKGLVSDARESQRIGKLTEQVIKTTGGAANISAAQVGDLATSISNKTGADDEAIQSGANLLLTFTNVKNEVGKGNDVFNQATGLVTDMSAALGQDAKAGAIQLGKALNDPTKGVTALSKVGVSFTAQQKEQIKTLQDSGDTMGAQKIILGELSKEFGGAAAATATKSQLLGVRVGNLREQLGTYLLPVVDAVSGFLADKLVPGLSAAATFVGRNASAFKVLVGVLGVVGAAVLIYMGVTKAVTLATEAWAFIQKVLNQELKANPIGLVVTVLALLAVGLIYAYKHSETFRNIVNATFGAVRSFVVGAIHTVIGIVRALGAFISGPAGAPFRLYFAVVKLYVGLIIGIVRTVLGGLVGIVKGIMHVVHGIFTGDWHEIKMGIGQAIGGIVTIVKGVPAKILHALGDLGHLLYDAGGKIIQGLVDGIGDAFGKVKGKLGDLTKSLTSWKGPPSTDRTILRGNGRLVIEGFVRGLDDRTPLVKSKLGALTHALPGAVAYPAGPAAGRSGAAIEQLHLHEVYDADAAGRAAVSALNRQTALAFPMGA
jgi:phage-related protein